MRGWVVSTGMPGRWVAWDPIDGARWFRDWSTAVHLVDRNVREWRALYEREPCS